MKVKELIEFLKTIDGELPVKIADSQYPTLEMNIGNISVRDEDVIFY